jgi:hypothetical protein
LVNARLLEAGEEEEEEEGKERWGWCSGERAGFESGCSEGGSITDAAA